MGLGVFAHLRNFYINYKLLIELVRSYDVFSNTIYTSVGEFMITSEKVGYAFGLNCTGDLFEKRQVDFENKLNEEERQALNLFKGKTLMFVQDMLPVIRDIENTRSRNWAHHVNSFLMDGIKKFKDKNKQAMKGCHFVQMIIYFKERYEGKSLNDPNAWLRGYTAGLERRLERRSKLKMMISQ
ncbi:hypothetical protein PIB30_016270 [Stylosanthes scabra]|uniref:Uncharacterized protein n=1 Tax=Stylosanthes scabra TaxID=79078 RepID=A0ABU6Z5T9_9FABA|nr:hypothetical protein [Stylosanthes scabra]